ncbi:MAG: HypC/HybG/HupF family hydrogenase formation chaperone [Candidatus Moduliflexus flocculans]|nr:HypC/HybG/HupF family hydrogenase formation chaperone [Candidatus Moduliflexus flocculans]
MSRREIDHVPGRSRQDHPARRIGPRHGRVHGQRGQRPISASSPRPSRGDWVIIHAGFAISVMDEEEARETLRLFKEMADAVRR